jgi:hypothetical protein
MNASKFLFLFLLLFTACETDNLTHRVIITEGSGSGDYQLGDRVNILADEAPEGQAFYKWTGDTTVLEETRSPNTSFTMPFSDVALQAIFNDLPRYALSIENGTGSGEYLAGTIVRITADPAPESYLFDKWIGAVEYVNDTAEVETTVEMPAEAITITAVYAAEPEELVSFSQEVWPLFQKSCTNSGCHSFSTPSEPLNSYQAIKEILPSVRSVIVSGAMPVEPYELTEAEKELIITWIDQGGLNN